MGKGGHYCNVIASSNFFFIVMKIVAPLFFLLFLFSSSCKKEEDLPRPQSLEELDQLIQQQMEQDQIPSLVAGIIKEDSLVWQQSYGYHDQENQEAPTSQTIYHLASISKTFTAVAALQLYEQGKLDLAQDINLYLPFPIRNPNFPDQPITARMLLTHTSSLAWPTNEENPQFNDRFSGDSAMPLAEWIPAYLIPNGDKYLSITWQQNAPGSTVQYTNVGLALLGYLVEVISGQNFARYCQDHIFGPLQMSHSGFLLSDVDTNLLATLYFEESVIEPYSVPHYPASMVKSSLEDLSHFLIAVMNGGVYAGIRILQEQTVQEMLRIQVPAARLGYIWQYVDNGWVGHNGGYWGVTSNFDFHPEKRVGVILLTNTNGKESLYSGGNIYRLVHWEAIRFAED